MVVVYLCLGHRFGFHLISLFLISLWLNAELKELFHTLRPFQMYPDILHPLYVNSAGGYSFPSGHAQLSAVVLGVLAVRTNTAWLRKLLVVLIFGIAFSRLYLHVHWPADVIGGLLIGFATVGLYVMVLGLWKLHKINLGYSLSALIIIGAAVGMLVLSWGNITMLRAGSVFLGSGLGYLIADRYGGHQVQYLATRRILKSILMILILVGIRIALKSIIGDETWAIATRYAIMGLCTTWLLPLILCGGTQSPLKSRIKNVR